MPLGLYVHIPFCSIKCFYCDFAAFSGQGSWEGRYLAALDKEASWWRGPRPTTLYVGGGTPSELSLEGTGDLFDIIEGRFGRDFSEATFEANPESLSGEKLSVLRRRGVGRLSLGLQTADDGLLRGIGRKHTAEDFFRVYRAARSAGFDVSVDLMYGLPGQDLDGFMSGLKQVLGLGLTHLSLYGLHVEDRTLFSRRGAGADEDLGREMYEAALDAVARAGLRHYEISNFALPGRESIHNRIYWTNGEYLGLGCSAASFLGGARSANLSRIEPYVGKALTGERPVAESESLQGKEKLGETVFLGLRLIEGLELTPELEETFGVEWAKLTSQGLVVREGPRVRLSREGVFFADRVFSEFVAPFDAPPRPARARIMEAAPA